MLSEIAAFLVIHVFTLHPSSVSFAMWRNLTTDITQWERRELSAWSSLPCLAAVAIPLAVGLHAGQPRLGVVAASGAMSVGFGAFHRLGRSNLGPMLLASVGMCISTLVGSLASHSNVAAVAVAGVWGFGYGMLGVFGTAISWTTLQWVIFLIVVSSNAYAVDTHQAVQRAALTLAGGLLQTLLVTGITFAAARWRIWRGTPLPPGANRDLDTPLQPWKPGGADFRFAWHLALTLAATTAVYRWLALPNGYWIPMTVAIVSKSDFYQTASRGLGRLAGTLLGAGLATLLAAELRPEPATTAVLIVLFHVVLLCPAAGELHALRRVHHFVHRVPVCSPRVAGKGGGRAPFALHGGGGARARCCRTCARFRDGTGRRGHAAHASGRREYLTRLGHFPIVGRALPPAACWRVACQRTEGNGCKGESQRPVTAGGSARPTIGTPSMPQLERRSIG